MKLGQTISCLIIRTNLHKPNNKFVNVKSKFFYAQMNHEQPRTHRTHHGPNLGEATTFPLIVYYIPNHRINTQMSFCPSIPK
jgi:hypothetical protein